jgi:hypothetical protein
MTLHENIVLSLNSYVQREKLTTRVDVADKCPEFVSPLRAHGNFLSYTSQHHGYDTKLNEILIYVNVTVSLSLAPRETYEVM